MKKLLVLTLIVLGLLTYTGLALASGAPYRYSTNVNDVSKPYTADEWIISPDEEQKGDQTVSNAKECDIKGIISCYDRHFLRFDILLHNSISFQWAVWYSVKLEYDDKNEYYTYYTDTKELIYEEEQNGKIVDKKTLTNKTEDRAGVSNSGNLQDSDVYFIINKGNHLDGSKGEKYYLTSNFSSGYVNDKDELQLADDTFDVDVEFKY